MRKIFYVMIFLLGVVTLYLLLAYFGTTKENSGCIDDSKRANEFCSKLGYEECQYYINNSISNNIIRILGEEHCSWRTDKNICYARIGCL